MLINQKATTVALMLLTILIVLPVKVFSQNELNNSQKNMVKEAVNMADRLYLYYSTGRAEINQVLQEFDDQNRYQTIDSNRDGLYRYEDIIFKQKYGHQITFRLTSEMFQVALWPGTTDFYDFWHDQLMVKFLTTNSFIYNQNHHVNLDGVKFNTYNIGENGQIKQKLIIKSIPQDGGIINVRLDRNLNIQHDEYKLSSYTHKVEIENPENLKSEWRASRSFIENCSIDYNNYYSLEVSCSNEVGYLSHKNDVITEMSNDFELSVKINLDEDSDFVGIGFGYEPNSGNTPLLALINSEFGLNIDKWDQEGRHALSTYRNSSLIRSGWNVFDLRKIHDSIYLYVNQKLAYTAPYKNWDSTDINFMVGKSSGISVSSIRYSYIESTTVSLSDFEVQEIKRLESEIQRLIDHDFKIIDLERGLFSYKKPSVTYLGSFLFMAFAESIRVIEPIVPYADSTIEDIIEASCISPYDDCVHVKEKNDYISTYDGFRPIKPKNESDISTLSHLLNEIIRFYR